MDLSPDQIRYAHILENILCSLQSCISQHSKAMHVKKPNMVWDPHHLDFSCGTSGERQIQSLCFEEMFGGRLVFLCVDVPFFMYGAYKLCTPHSPWIMLEVTIP